MPSEPIEPGYFGKVHTHGDFVSRGLPKNFIEPWDRWLQESVQASRQQLGDEWLDYYLTSPLYRFVLTPGICGNHGWLGVLMPSVDKVGRYYPMTIGLMCNKDINPFLALQTKNKWFEGIERHMLFCLDDHFNLEEFNVMLKQQKCENLSDISGLDTGRWLDSTLNKNTNRAWQYSLTSLQSIPALLPYLLDNSLKEYCFAYSLWWTPGSEAVAPSMMFSEGLPHFAGMAAMLDGNWQKWGWEGKRFPLAQFGLEQ